MSIRMRPIFKASPPTSTDKHTKIGTLFTWLVGKWPVIESFLYAVTTMSMNTPYSGPHVEATGTEMVFFHRVHTFLRQALNSAYPPGTLVCASNHF